MLKKILKEKKCFKLICGAGNENLQEVERLVALYAAAGCHFFDLSASEEVLAAAQKGLDFAISKEEQKDYHFCVSIGTKNDPHFKKASIDSEKCKRCGKCIKACPQNAIEERVKLKSRSGILAQQPKAPCPNVVEQKCIGCLKCQKVCECNAISFHFSPFTFNLPSLFPLSSSLSCIELHASDMAQTQEYWDYLCNNFSGMLSVCIGRDKFSNEEVLDLLRKLVSKRKPYTTIIQADGSPMSGGEDDFKTTLQAVAMAEVVQNANLPAYILLSGGTNSKTAELAKLYGIDFNGIGVGSYARKIVKNYIIRKDFFENEAIFEASSKIASILVNSV